MKLVDFLKVIGKEDYVGIWNIDDRKGNGPTQQQYCKSQNLSWDKLRNIIDYNVLGINHTEKGYLVRVYSKDRVDRSLSEWGVVNKYFQRLDQRNGVKRYE